MKKEDLENKLKKYKTINIITIIMSVAIISILSICLICKKRGFLFQNTFINGYITRLYDV